MWRHKFWNYFSIWVFFHDYSRITELQGMRGGTSLTPHYHFHPLHRHLDISRTITAESSLLPIDSSRTRIGNLWFPGASCKPLSYTKLWDYETNTIFLIEPFFLHDQKVKKKKISLERKELSRWNKKHFSLKQVKQIFLEEESSTLKLQLPCLFSFLWNLWNWNASMKKTKNSIFIKLLSGFTI